MRTTALTGLLAATLACAGCVNVNSERSSSLADGSPVAEEDYGGLPSVMRQKMFYTQRVLSGMALEDYDMIAQNASELVWLSNLGQWSVVDSPEYEQFSTAFRECAQDISRAASAQDMARIEAAYAHLTRACLKCHVYLRDMDIVGLPGAQTYSSSCRDRSNVIAAIDGSSERGVFPMAVDG